ncbi:hypothetical protein JHL18_12975 [Clostridium sp. YIM B02505]|uniref:PH domain-containing protein n=1 Tax=Clostridium yunnanense TaxID=2800325 RepID=A0ABS1EQB2_9CLOT|nr:hypothetical protein [Clostridium yunnanense]MBK1811534.1 hypothetical protein [Clostridium yunnanense]
MAMIKNKNKRVALKPKKKTIINIKSKTHEEIEYWASLIKEAMMYKEY